MGVAAQVMQVYQMDAMNFRFLGHPSAWVVHRPHAPSSGYNHTFTGEAYTQVSCAWQASLLCALLRLQQ